MKEMTAKEAYSTAHEIVKLLDGVRISEARWVLTEAEALLAYTHRVDANNPGLTVEDGGAKIVPDE